MKSLDNFDNEIKKYIIDNRLLECSDFFTEKEFSQFGDLDLEDWKNVVNRNLLSPYAFENYYQLIISPEQRIDTIYVLSKLDEKYWNNIFKRCLYLLIGLKIFYASDLMLLSMLTDREFERADKLGVFDYDNVLMQNLSCKALFRIAKYPEPLLEESVKRNVYKDFNLYIKLLRDKTLFPDASDNLIAFALKNKDFSGLENERKEIRDKIFFLKSTQMFFPQSAFFEKGFVVKNISELSGYPNLRFFVHGISRQEDLNKFLILKQNEVISSSYIQIQKGNTDLFYRQGLILNVSQENIHAGYYKDMLTFEQIDTEILVQKYIFNKENNMYRTYFPSLLKSSLGLPESKAGDEAYIEFFRKYKNKKLEEIDDENIRARVLHYLDSIPVKYYERYHNHNELLITEPEITGVYTSNIEDIPEFLLCFAKERDLPVCVLE